jgi:hypothetical protein
VGAVSDLSRNTEYPSYTKGKGKAIPVTDRGDPQGCETSRLPHIPENRLTDGGEVVRLTRWPAVPPPLPQGIFLVLILVRG